MKEWISVMDGLPTRKNDEFYGRAYSLPVIVANKHTKQVFDMVVVFNYDDNGWCYNTLPDGPNASDYEVCCVTHYQYLPEIN